LAVLALAVEDDPELLVPDEEQPAAMRARRATAAAAGSPRRRRTAETRPAETGLAGRGRGCVRAKNLLVMIILP
jgi:hypothetical protein